MTTAAAPAFSMFATVAAEKQPLIVSVHDVAPATRAACDEIVREIGKRGVDICSLLVVPDYQQSGSSTADVEFVRWLRNLESAGHEIVIHGYYHQRPRAEAETLGARFLTRYYTKGEGEFYDLDYDEALRRITRARNDFAAAGLKPRGFIAPAWLLGPEAERAAADAEMEYTTRLTTIRDLRTGDDFHARSLVYSVRSGWRRVMSLGWNGALCRMMWDAPLIRLGIHPPDIRHPAVWEQISRLADNLSESRTATTYCGWLGNRRAANGADR